MSDANNQGDVLIDDTLIEENFNAAIEEFRKSIGDDADEELNKAKKPKKKKEPAATEPDEDDMGEDEDDMDEDDYQKSIPDMLAEDQEAAFAMDVSPYLGQLAKAIDRKMTAIANQFVEVKSLIKSHGEFSVAMAELQKSSNELIKKIGSEPIRSNSIRTLAKSRFESSDGAVEYDNQDVLQKSRDWVKAKKIGLIEAGVIEQRVNKGTLGLRKDAIDTQVARLMQASKEGN